MKLYHTHVVLQDKTRDLKPAYSIAVEPVLTLENAFKNIDRFIRDDSLICCSGYIAEEDCEIKAKRLVYARNFVSITGSYYPYIKNFEGVHFNIEEEMKRYA